MRAQPLKYTPELPGYSPCELVEATHVRLMMPGPIGNRILPITLRERTQTPQWWWNGDTQKPTLQPSLMTRDGQHVCHSFVTDGVVRFLDDCTHEFRGQCMELLEVDVF